VKGRKRAQLFPRAGSQSTQLIRFKPSFKYEHMTIPCLRPIYLPRHDERISFHTCLADFHNYFYDKLTIINARKFLMAINLNILDEL
jgi:hypothetical protein